MSFRESNEVGAFLRVGIASLVRKTGMFSVLPLRLKEVQMLLPALQRVTAQRVGGLREERVSLAPSWVLAEPQKPVGCHVFPLDRSLGTVLVLVPPGSGAGRLAPVSCPENHKGIWEGGWRVLQWPRCREDVGGSFPLIIWCDS